MYDRVSYLGSVSWSDEDGTVLVLVLVGCWWLALKHWLQVAGAVPD